MPVTGSAQPTIGCTPRLLGGDGELQRAEQVGPVGQRHGRHVAPRAPACPICVGLDRAFQQRIGRADAQVDEARTQVVRLTVRRHRPSTHALRDSGDQMRQRTHHPNEPRHRRKRHRLPSQPNHKNIPTCVVPVLFLFTVCSGVKVGREYPESRSVIVPVGSLRRAGLTPRTSSRSSQLEKRAGRLRLADQAAYPSLRGESALAFGLRHVRAGDV